MKNYLFILLLFVSYIGLSQNNHILRTEDGRRVLLKADYSWEYIDMDKTLIDSTVINLETLKEKGKCNISQGFEEPKLDNKIQSQLKKGRATIDDIKKKVAKESNCKVEDVILLLASEQKSKGVYHFCVKGTKVSYKRIGHTVIKQSKFF